MNAIVYALEYIRNFGIPDPILFDAFTYGSPHIAREMTSIDERIVAKVIVGRVIRDMDNLYGVEDIISLAGLTPNYDVNYNAVFKVPNDRTNGRLITRVIGLGSAPIGAGAMMGAGFPQMPVGGSAPNSGCCDYMPSELNGMLGKVYDSHRSGPYSDYKTNVDLIGPNTLLVTGYNFVNSMNLMVRVNFANDKNLNNISSNMYDKFANMCLLATKAYIYNTLIIPLNEGKLSGGQDLSTYTSIVESYSSALEDYKNTRENGWGVALFSNDRRKVNRLIDSMTGCN